MKLKVVFTHLLHFMSHLCKTGFDFNDRQQIFRTVDMSAVDVLYIYCVRMEIKGLLTIDRQMNSSVNTNSVCAPSGAEIQAGVRLLHLQELQSQRAVLQSSAAADPTDVCGVIIHRVFKFTKSHRQQRQQLVRAQQVPGDVRAGCQVTGERDVLPSLDHQGGAENR